MISMSMFAACQNNVWVAEASTIQLEKNLKQIYPDACDLGFEIVSPRTGCVISVVESEILRHDGEIAVFIYTPTAQSVKANPQIKNMRFRVLND